MMSSDFDEINSFYNGEINVKLILVIANFKQYIKRH